MMMGRSCGAVTLFCMAQDLSDRELCLCYQVKSTLDEDDLASNARLLVFKEHLINGFASADALA